MKKKCTLEDALDYQNENVIFRFVKVFVTIQPSN